MSWSCTSSQNDLNEQLSDIASSFESINSKNNDLWDAASAVGSNCSSISGLSNVSGVSRTGHRARRKSLSPPLVPAGTLRLDLSKKESTTGKEQPDGQYARQFPLSEMLSLPRAAPTQFERWEQLSKAEQAEVINKLDVTVHHDDVADLIRIYGEILVKQRDSAGNIPLHTARTAEIAAVLIDAIAPEEREEHLRATNEIGHTVLHSASMLGRVDVICYLLELCPGLLNVSDLYGNTPLHYSKDMQTAAYLLRSASSDHMRQTLITKRNNNGETPLHTACENGHEDVLEYLLLKIQLDKNQFILAVNDAGNTPLHLAKSATAAKMLLEACKSEFGNQYMSCLDIQNKNKQNVLHTASFTQDEVELLVYLMTQISQNNSNSDHLLTPDKDGNTPLLLSISHDKDNFAKTMLESCNTDTIRKLLMHRNHAHQNAFHIASQQLRSNVFLDILTFYQDVEDTDFDKLMEPDNKGNSPLKYLAGSYKVEHFSNQVLSLSLPKRRRLMFDTNASDVHCRLIADKEESSEQELNQFFLRSVLNDRSNRNLLGFYGDMVSTWQWLLIRKSCKLNYDPRLRHILYYATLEYPKPQRRSNEVTIHRISDYLKSTNIKAKGDGEPCIWIEISSATKQEELAALDMPELHGKPKLVVISRREELGSKLLPTSPDFLMMKIKSNFELPIRGFAGLASCYDLKDIVQKICHDQDVMSTMIDSTLGRHLLANGQDLCLGEQPMADAAYVTGDATRRGKALIICYENTKGRRKRTGYTTQLSEAYKILSEQFHLVTKLKKDMQAADIMREITETFTNDTVQLAALAIMAHGDEQGNILDVDGESVSVQSLVDRMSETITDAPILLLLSYCRGSIETKYNRTASSFECTELPKLVESAELMSVVTQTTTITDPCKHAHVDLPVNCYILYTTLPDSKSPENNCTFGVMRQYLSDVWRVCKQRDEEIERGARDELRQLLPHVELTTMLTDVCGLTRHKSNHRIYPHLQYSVDRNSKPVVIDVRPDADDDPTQLLVPLTCLLIDQ